MSLLPFLDLIMSHSGAQGSVGSHSAIGLRNYKVLLTFYKLFLNTTKPFIFLKYLTFIWLIISDILL